MTKSKGFKKWLLDDNVYFQTLSEEAKQLVISSNNDEELKKQLPTYYQDFIEETEEE